ncbi:hypothetical protein C367_01989 [Cryptococcus neoformans Ze90-1]|nr:hypothetical protein C367_01989 [Cryptococcus neoformans var. grubii Ze90-1]
MIEEDACIAFVTSCGFLATMHPFLSNRLPFMGTTSLLQVTWLQNSFFPGSDSKDSVGVVTFKKSALTVKHLISVGAHPETPVYGLPEDTKTAIFRGVLDERIPYDYEGMEKEVVDAALFWSRSTRKSRLSFWSVPICHHLLTLWSRRQD